MRVVHRGVSAPWSVGQHRPPERLGKRSGLGELGEVVLGRTQGRTSESDITVFKSLGMAVEDVVAADLALRRAVDAGVGTEFTL